jgi:predicted transcriptional regulator
MKKQEMVKTITDAEQVNLFENPNYSRILVILRKGELTIKEIHKYFNTDYEDKKTLSTIYRYMEKLTACGLVFVSNKELKKKHIIESYYSRTALFFTFKQKRAEKAVVNAVVELLQHMYKVDEGGDELTQLIQEYTTLCQHDEDFYKDYGEKILELEKKYGLKVIKEAINIAIELLYFEKNPELLEKIFKVFKG